MPVLSKIDDAIELPDIVERALTRKQLSYFSDYLNDLCRTNQLTDKSLMKLNTKGQKVSNANQGKALKCNVWDGDEKNMDDFFKEINMHDIVENVVKPMTQGPATSGRFPTGCSYAETVCTEPQLANTFVSHYWGQPFAIFYSALEGYIKRRGARSEILMWICSFAHRHWCIEQELGSNSDAFPFARVINHPNTQSTVLITAADCGALRRFWCLFEMHKAIQKRRHDLDIVVGSAGSANVRVLRTSDVMNPDSKLIDGDLWEKLLDIHVENAVTSKFADKHLLLSQIQVSGMNAFNSTIKKRIARHAFGFKVSGGDIEFVKDMLTSQVDVNAFDTSSSEGSPLHVAAAVSGIEIAKLLLKAKADVNDQRNPLLHTPLHKAKDSQMIKLLLDHGADSERSDTSGALPKLKIASAEEPPSSATLAEKPDDLPVALQDAGTQQDRQQEEDDVIYDELLSLFMTEKPISTKLDWKFSGKIRMPRRGKEILAN